MDRCGEMIFKVWRGCKLRIYVIAQSDEDNDDMKQRLQKHIYMLRIDATVFVSPVIERSNSPSI